MFKPLEVHTLFHLENQKPFNIPGHFSILVDRKLEYYGKAAISWLKMVDSSNERSHVCAIRKAIENDRIDRSARSLELIQRVSEISKLQIAPITPQPRTERLQRLTDMAIVCQPIGARRSCDLRLR